MIVVAQIESKKAWDNLDDILKVKGLTGVTGGPHDFAASMGLPGQPDHPDRVAATLDVDKRARAAGKIAGGDLTTGTGAAELMLSVAREFADKHKRDKVGS
jgi:4-hydroxy-2-oxoheptanedioate aldolase